MWVSVGLVPMLFVKLVLLRIVYLALMSVCVDYDALGGMLKLSSWGIQLLNGFRIYIDGSMHTYSIAVIRILIRTLPSPNEPFVA